jgi:hypothetical protein
MLIDQQEQIVQMLLTNTSLGANWTDYVNITTTYEIVEDNDDDDEDTFTRRLSQASYDALNYTECTNGSVVRIRVTISSTDVSLRNDILSALFAATFNVSKILHGVYYNRTGILCTQHQVETGQEIIELGSPSPPPFPFSYQKLNVRNTVAISSFAIGGLCLALLIPAALWAKRRKCVATQGQVRDILYNTVRTTDDNEMPSHDMPQRETIAAMPKLGVRFP